MCPITLEKRLAITAKINLSYEPATAFLVIYPTEMSANVHQKTCNKYVHSPIIKNSLKMEPTHVFINSVRYT